ncbi:hypothetical protein [Halobellus clavatus]|uniref:tRNA_anti-like n=1 Tax=Halobellus clavatus TaxID=660517 RepID=A0A1H3DKV8_9EURY|nr:hypothetical protein [Halobellus clavatus]SDX66274.1 hypothetical protein SAMN04487946_101600 [Halobellus clavatus]
MSPEEEEGNSKPEDVSENDDSGEKQKSDSIIDWELLVYGIFGVIILYSIFMSMFVSSGTEGAQPVEDGNDRVYVNDSLSEIQSVLLGSDSTYTDLQKDEIWSSKYRGKWIRASAYVHSVDENAFGKLVVLAGPQAESELDIGFSPYRIGFKESERGDLLRVSPNQRIRFEGKLTDYGGITSSISISEARLIE